MTLYVTLSGSVTDGLVVRWTSSSSTKPENTVVSIRSSSSSSASALRSKDLEWTCVLTDASAGILRLLPEVVHSEREMRMTVNIRGGRTDAGAATSRSSPSTVDGFVVDSTGSTSGVISSFKPDDDSETFGLSRLSLTRTSAPCSTLSDAPVTFLGLGKRGTILGARGRGSMTSPVVRIERQTDHRKATVVWTSSSYAAGPDKVQVELQDKLPGDINGVECSVVHFVDGRANRFEFPDGTFESGQRYRVTVKLLKLSARPNPVPSLYVDSYSVVGEKTVEFRADLTIDELRRLHKKARHDIGSNSTTCRWLYRNKSPQYFADMFNKKGGIMETYIKDNSGDPASPINGEINGLFFMAEVEPWSTNAEPVRASAFGSTRLLVPVRVLLDMMPNLYFSDYYCMRGAFHYVTLVATQPDSETDRFCRKHLLPLSIYNSHDNPFLFEGYRGEMRVAVGTKIELLFTEDIDVYYLATYTGAVIQQNIPLIGKGHTTPGGVRKKPNCTTCNIYHPQFRDYDSDENVTNDADADSDPY